MPARLRALRQLLVLTVPRSLDVSYLEEQAMLIGQHSSGPDFPSLSKPSSQAAHCQKQGRPSD